MLTIYKEKEFMMKVVAVYFFYFLCVQSAFAATTPSQTSDSADFIFDYVNKAQNSIELTSNPNIILVTGITGGGKSTLTHYVTGDYSKMISIEPTEAGGEYTIYDGLDPDVNKTNLPTESRTLVPELNIDEQKNAFYDCPGFADTRNETIEIATTFLIKKIIENAKNIKIVLVINFESVTDGHDRLDFDNSLTRLTELVQNIKRFENSISIVITKVPSYTIRGGNIVEVLESSVKNSTARFAANHRLFLQQKGATGADKRIQLIDALLKLTPNGDYPKIAVFWRPMKAGPLDKIEKMVEGRQSIRDTIHKQTSYTNYEKNDFGFPLSAETKLKISQIAKVTIAQISSVLKNIDSQLLSALQQKIQSIDNFHSKFEALELGLTNIRGKQPTTMNEWIDQLKTVIRTYGISSIDLNQFNQITRQENNLNILKSIANGTDVAAPIRDLIANSSTATKYQTIEHRWYSFLAHIFDFFIGYEVQKDVSAYNVANLADWGQTNKPQGLVINEQTFDAFLKRFPNMPVNEISPTAPRLRELNDIVGITLRSPVQYDCDGDTMIIKGNIGKSSDIQVTKCGKRQLKKIHVYIMSTFFVDADINLSGIDELKIYAPKWSVQRATTFNLNGINAAAQPGKAGDNGGNFFGYANEMVNGELLTVTMNGGNGANGQNGTGKTGDKVRFRGLHNEKSAWFGFSHSPLQMCKLLLKERGYDVEPIGKTYLLILHAKCCRVNAPGGKGGLGGQPGFYSFISDVNGVNHLPKSVANIGKTGRKGSSGKCESKAAEVRCNFDYENNILTQTRYIDIKFQKYVPEPRCEDKFLPSTELVQPQQQQQQPRLPLDIAAGIIAYKAVLVENMNNFAFKTIIQKVYRAIESNPQINQAYSVSAFAVEANSLEKHFFRLNEQIDMYPFYRNLTERIDGYMLANDKNVAESGRKVLSILYTTIFGKAASIRSGHKSDLIVDVLDYLDVALRNVARLDDIGRMRVISALRDQYRDELEEKIKEAKNYIDNDIQPEIAAIFANLKVEMEETVDEIIALEARTISEIQRKQEMARKVRKQAALQKIFGVLGLVAKVFLSFSSIGGIVTSIIGLAAGWTAGGKVPELDTTNDFVFQMRKINGDELEAIEKQLNNLKAFVNGNQGDGKNPGIIEIGKKLSDFGARVSTIKSNPSFGATRTILKDVLEFVNKPLAATDKVPEQFLKPFEQARNILSVVASSISTYKQFSNSNTKLDEIGSAIQRDRDTLNALMAFEDQIYDKLIPLLDIVQINLRNVSNSLDKKSLVALEIEKWKISSVLHGVQAQFAFLLHGFGTEYQVANYLRRIEESMNSIINIFERIQNYQEQARFAIYMSELQSADYRNLVVNDTLLQDIINELRFNLHANILLAQYDRAVDAFKQAVFPFAADYLDIYELPKSLQPSKDDSMDSIILPVSENIRSLRDRIHELNNSVINENDMVIFNAYFDRYDNGSYGPFYVWKNVDVNKQIEELFAGKKVYLLADVAKSSIKLNAIKFKSVRLEFNSVENNRTENDRLNEILESFHVSLMHMGASDYRCNNEFYTIYSRPLTIEYSFATRRHIPSVRNSAFDKLNAASPLLSPHTVWAIQLTKGPFNKLEGFTRAFDIELHGLGQYVKGAANICNTNLQKYYPNVKEPKY